jgi:hypothetical protein
VEVPTPVSTQSPADIVRGNADHTSEMDNLAAGSRPPTLEIAGAPRRSAYE